MERFSAQGAAELRQLEKRLLALYSSLRDIPTLALRADLNLIPVLLGRYLPSLLKLLPHLGTIQGSVADLMQEMRDPWLRRLIDLECFLLSGLKAEGTVAPEVAFMFGERSCSVVDYPIGGVARSCRPWSGDCSAGVANCD